MKTLAWAIFCSAILAVDCATTIKLGPNYTGASAMAGLLVFGFTTMIACTLMEKGGDR